MGLEILNAICRWQIVQPVRKLVVTLVCRVRLPAPKSDASVQFVVEPIEYGGVPEWPKGTDCKSAALRFDGSNPSSPTTRVPMPYGVGTFVFEGGFESRLVETDRGTVSTGVAFRQKSEAVLPHHKSSNTIWRWNFCI